MCRRVDNLRRRARVDAALDWQHANVRAGEAKLVSCAFCEDASQPLMTLAFAGEPRSPVATSHSFDIATCRCAVRAPSPYITGVPLGAHAEFGRPI